MEDTIFADMIPETRGRHAKYDFELDVNGRKVFPAEGAANVRMALVQFRKRNHPKWKFRTWVADGELNIVRIK